MAGVAEAGNNAADIEPVVSKEDIRVQHRMADHTYSEDKRTWKILSKCLKRVTNELTVNCYQGRQTRTRRVGEC